MAKAAASAADHVFLDLEDAVAPSEKAAARVKVVTALRELDWGRKTRCVRINDLSSPYLYEDIVAVVEQAGDFLDTLMLTKVKRAADVDFVATLLGLLERKSGRARPIGIEVLIEEAEALENVSEIARASPRVEALVLGFGDLSASLGIDLQFVGSTNAYPGDLWHFARCQLVTACRAAGVDPIDGPVPDYRNLAAYAEDCRRACALGMVGKWAIHPAQIAPALTVFTPSAESLAGARRMVETFRAAAAEGKGALSIDGTLVDNVSLRMAQNVLDKATLYGL
jgi:citrate lyase subunit beta/citryl-CoA lyase